MISAALIPNLRKLFVVEGLWDSVLGVTEFYTDVVASLHAKFVKGSQP